MPFKSEKQRKWMHANKPEMAKKWEKKKKTELVPNMAVINPDAQAKMLQRAKDREIRKGVKLKTALNNKNHDDHNKAKSIWQKIKDRIMKNRKEYATELVKRVKEQRTNSVNEGEKRDFHNAYAKYYKTYEAFAREVMRLAKSISKISGDKTDEKIILKNFKKQVIPFAGLMNSWDKGKQNNPHIDEGVLNEATYVKGKMMVILKNSFNQVHRSLSRNVSLSDSMDDNQKARLAMFQKRMSAAREDYVKAVMRATKPFDKEITGV